MNTMTPKNGSPSGNIRMGRRFTSDELARIAAGESIEAIVVAAGRIPTREEMYAALFAA